MKKVVRKIVALTLVFVFLIANNTYAITSHFCGSYLVDVSFLGKTSSCSMETSDDDCDSEPKITKDCCKDITQIVESEIENSKLEVEGISFELSFQLSFIATFLNQYSLTKKEYEFPKDNSPPDLDQDFQILFETFLI